MESLCKTYRTRGGKPVQALQGLSLEVRPGEIFGYIGVNGAGKSTSIKILLGLIQASDGAASIFGCPAGSLEARRKIGYLPEVATYHEFMTAEELLWVHAILAGVPSRERQKRCRESLEMVGLGERSRSRISEFSKGMKQRFGIAQALVARPPLLILDELTSGLDPFAQKDLRDILLRLKAESITIFFSSHHMTEVEQVCDRAAIIHQGQLRACGTIDELTAGIDQVEVLLESQPEDAVTQPEGFEKQSEGHYRAILSRAEAHQKVPAALARGFYLKRYQNQRLTLEEVFHRITRSEALA